MHTTHLPVPGLHTGAVFGQSVLVVHVVPHVWVVGLQIGLSFGHSDDFVHSTHVFVVGSHWVFGATQLLLSVGEHSVQRPLVHTGVGAEQFVFVVQPVVHVWVFVSHLPAAPVHCASLLHWTQTSFTASHTGFAEVQAVRFVVRHSTH